MADDPLMPKDGATLTTATTERSLNPVRTVAGTSSNGAIVVVTLKYISGAVADPKDVFDALVVKYGSGKVTTDRDSLHPGVLDLTIAP